VSVSDGSRPEVVWGLGVAVGDRRIGQAEDRMAQGGNGIVTLGRLFVQRWWASAP